MKRRIHNFFSLGMQLRERRQVDDVIQQLTQRKREILGQGYDEVLVEMLDPCDSDDGLARLMLVGERDETDEEFEARTKNEKRQATNREANEREFRRTNALEVLKGLTRGEALELWKEAKEKK